MDCGGVSGLKRAAWPINAFRKRAVSSRVRRFRHRALLRDLPVDDGETAERGRSLVVDGTVQPNEGDICLCQRFAVVGP